MTTIFKVIYLNINDMDIKLIRLCAGLKAPSKVSNTMDTMTQEDMSMNPIIKHIIYANYT